MTFQSRISSLLVFVVLTSLFVLTPATSDTPEREWKVQVGDTMTFCVLKRFESTDGDGDGDVNSLTWEITDDEGSKVNVTEKTGTRIKIDITGFEDLNALVKRIYDGKITTKESREYVFIEKTVDNQSYWEEEAERRSDSDYPHWDCNYYLEGDEFVKQHRENHTHYYPIHNASMEKITKRNWRTGWLTYEYIKVANNTSTFIEYEIGVCKTPVSIPGFDLTLLILSFTVLTLVITRKRASC